MEKDNYNNNESKFSEVIELLKNLPKIEAPANFEFNLSTRIQNGNFNLSKKRQIPKWMTLSFGPIAAIALSTIVFFFVISNSSFQTENLLIQNPELRQPLNVANNAGAQTNSKTLIMETQISKSTPSKLKAIIQPNDVVVASKVKFPFNSANSVNLDDYINGANGTVQNNSNIQTVSSIPTSANFNGFGIPVKTTPEQLAAMRNEIDSLRTVNSGK